MQLMNSPLELPPLSPDGVSLTLEVPLMSSWPSTSRSTLMPVKYLTDQCFQKHTKKMNVAQEVEQIKE